MSKPNLRCSECDYEFDPLLDNHCYYVLTDGIVCEDCFVEFVKNAVEENPALFAELLNVSRVEVVS